MAGDQYGSTNPDVGNGATRVEYLERELADLRAESTSLGAALRASEQKLAEVFRLAPSFMCLLGGPDHVFQLANEPYYQLLGHRELVGKSLAEAVPETAGQVFPRLLDEVYRTGRPFVGTDMPVLLRRTPGGPPEERFVDFVYLPLRGPDGSVTGVLVQGTDITERKAADAVLRADRQFFHSSIDALSSTIAVLDEAGVILAVNDAWRRFADANQYVGPAYGVGRSYVGECERGAGLCTESRLVAAGLDAVLHGRQPVFELEYPCHSPAEQRWFVMRATRFPSPGPVRVVVAHEDVTLRKQSEQALEDADRRKDEFLATLAHELRNPLAPLRTGLHVLKMTGTDAAAAPATLAMMDRQLGQMVRLVDDLLDVSRINSGKLDLRRERVELAAVLLNAVETSRPLIDRHGHELTAALPPGPVPLDADPVRLAQVFSNLLNNAAKYSDPGGRIGLTADVAGGHVTVRVRDAGIGIDPGQLARVFDMFAQVQTALEKSQGGLGIGLSLVKGLVGMHGGTVEVTSAGLGRGSEFVVRLPVATGFSAETAPAEEVPSRRPATRRVLVVDDNVDAAESLGELIAFAGHEVRTAHDGFAGVAAAAEFRPDVILLDLGMPKLNGYEAARRVRQEAWGGAVVLVALTGWGSAEDRRKTAAAGFDHHLVKPVESATILKLLAAVPSLL